MTPRITPGVLHREEALGDDDVEQRPSAPSVADGDERASSGWCASTQSQRAAVDVDHALEGALRRAVERVPARLAVGWRRSVAHIIGVSVSESSAETPIGDGQRDRELAEQPADDARP